MENNEVSNRPAPKPAYARLIAFQPQEFDPAGSLQRRILRIQIALAVLACLAVFLLEGKLTYLVLVLTLIGSTVWISDLVAKRRLRQLC